MADIIEIAEGVAAEIGDGAEVLFAPEFDLKGIKEKRIVVVPAGIETKPNARDYLEDRLKVQVGVLKKCTEDDVPALIREVVALGVGRPRPLRQGGVQSALLPRAPARAQAVHGRCRAHLPLGTPQ